MRDIQAKLGQVVMNDVANKRILPLNVDEVVRVASKCTVPPFGHKAIHGKVNLVLHGYKMNVMTHGLEKRSPSLPLGIDVQTVYTTLADGSNSHCGAEEQYSGLARDQERHTDRLDGSR